MFKRKLYGESRLPACPFCGRSGVVRNSQGISVCERHRESAVKNLRCTCGSNLELKIGKWGPYASCESCGNLSWSRICEINSLQNKAMPIGGREIVLTSEDCGAERFEQRPKPSSPMEVTISSDDPEDKPLKSKPARERKEITITSDDINYF